MDFLSMTAPQVEALPEDKAREALDAWVKAKKPELAQALASSASKAHAKLAKKALYQLQSSGVQAAPLVEPKVAPAPVDEPPKNEFPGVLSMQLGSGERAFFFAAPVRGGGLELFQGIVHDEVGLAQFGSQRANRNLYRKRLRELETDPSAHVMLVPFERIQLELGRAITLNERVKAEYGSDIADALARLKVTPKDPEFPVPPLEAGDEATSADGASLHALFEVAQWMPSEGDLVTLTNRVDAIRILPLTDEQKAEKQRQFAHQLAAEVFTPAVRAVYARRLWYTAEVVESLGRPDDVAKLRAEARRLMHGTAPSTFAQGLFEKVLATMPKKAGALPKLEK